VFLERTIDNIKQYVHWQAVELGFNLDEVGSSTGEDRCRQNVIVPTVCEGRMIHHKVKRLTKHVTALVCVTAVEDLLPPYLVITQRLNQEFFGSGLVMGR
jgi:hypothetical protein